MSSEDRARAFVEAVVAQAALLLGGETHLAARVRTLLDDPGAAAAERLRGEPVLLAAFFQNIDLLYQHGHPRADAVALLVMQALEGLDGEDVGALPDDPGRAAPEASG